MLVPALIYVAINRSDPQALHGWAIPAATDIAFALGVLALLGERVPVSLKVFLMALAIMDDLGAIVIIALFYSGDLSGVMLLLAFVSILVLFTFNRCRITSIAPYVTVGALLWLFVLKSGIHATLAGVVIAFTIPLHGRERESSPLETLEHDLQPWVNFMILPVFAFANAGLPLAGVGLADFFEPVALGIFLGLVAGKLLGVFCCSWISIRFGLTALPRGATFPQLLGVSALCGIGFTMSLFIGGLAFQHTGADYFVAHRIGILAGSLLAALFGLAILSGVTKKPPDSSLYPPDQGPRT